VIDYLIFRFITF